MEKIISRYEEKQILTDFLLSKQAEFLAIYGRRRVGKSFLIKNFFSNKKCILLHVTGIKNGKYSEQIKEFTKQIGNIFYNGIALKCENNWLDTFALLNKSLEKIDKRKKVVIFLDELPWMATKKSRLLQAIEYNWNHDWNWDKRIKLIVCGSSASWILKKIINNIGGLYNRITKRIKLEPFNLSQAKEYLQEKGINLNNKQILEIYMTTGGIPLYLNYIQKGLSAHQNLNRLCFTNKGFLKDEFPNLIESLFNESSVYFNILKNIAKHPYGIEKNTLAKSCNVTLGGRFTERLTELEEADFITSFIPYGHKGRDVYYKIIDEFTLFYFYWMENKRMGLAKNAQKEIWQSMAKSAAYKSWLGYSFEAICYKHIQNIMQKLDIVLIEGIGSWRYFPYKKKENGAQIDLLFDRPDDAITICEIKYTTEPFAIDKQYAKNLQNKVDVFKKITRTTKQIFIAMISANGLKPTMYSEELISGCVTLDDLFKN